MVSKQKLELPWISNPEQTGLFEEKL